MGIWDVGDVEYPGCEILGMWDVEDRVVGHVECWGCGMLDVRDVECSGCEMFEMWDVWDVGCSGCGMFAGMWDVDLQNAEHMDISILTEERVRNVKETSISDHLFQCDCLIDLN